MDRNCQDLTALGTVQDLALLMLHSSGEVNNGVKMICQVIFLHFFKFRQPDGLVLYQISNVEATYHLMATISPRNLY